MTGATAKNPLNSRRSVKSLVDVRLLTHVNMGGLNGMVGLIEGPICPPHNTEVDAKHRWTRLFCIAERQTYRWVELPR